MPRRSKVCYYALVILTHFVNCRRRDLSISTRYWLNLGEPYVFDSAIITTCGEGGAANNPGHWKPRRLIDGVTAMVKSARKVGSKSQILIISFSSEPQAYTKCVESTILRQAGAICHELDDSVRKAKGYGYAKITAILGAPARVILWIDADAWFVRNPDPLIHRAKFSKTGAFFLS
mmetsp:Transcript_9720/g.14866  ORF Transcript_9720/g.14866 Transcript_9720/m.14866 type:complete len:176 (+) Transcript_9720:38-565(+)